MHLSQAKQTFKVGVCLSQEFSNFKLFHTEGFYHPDAGHGFLQSRGQISHRFLGDCTAFPKLFSYRGDNQDAERQQNER